jgi:asparagine synthase (glutamine-hydrolysing)
VSGRPASTWSIGFAAEGYDEMEYARIAAAHFRTDHHEHYVTPADVVDAIPIVAAAFDQPFGNASAVPTLCCARLARNAGVERMLGGDGGDELFGGNARYATQQQLAFYEKVPGPLRRGLVEPLLLGMPGATSLPLVRKLRSYITQARVPMPARYDSYNLLERLGPDAVFEPAFLETVNRAGPLAHVEDVWAGAQAQSLINRMLALDLKLTLADNDLPKVTRSCEAAGVDVAFPLLDDGVVAFAASLPPRFKLRGTTLRWFFKRALDDFLPPAILVKQKHGFGLPAGVWMRDYAPLRELAREALSSLAKRGIVRRALIDDLVDRRLAEHPAYFGTLAWILMMLELWFTTRSD